MTCSEFKENAWAYAIDALDADERRACEGHLTAQIAHQGCREELAKAYRLSATLSSGVVPVRPPGEVWARIESQIAAAVQTESAPSGRPSRGGWWVALAASMLAAVLGWLFLGARNEAATLGKTRTSLEAQLARTQGELRAARSELEAFKAELADARSLADVRQQALALLETEGTRVVLMKGQGAHRASAIFHPGQQKAFIVGSALVPEPGKDYELWIIRGKNPPVPAGLLETGPDGRVVMPVDPKLLADPVDAFAISHEPEGGSDAPRGPIVLVGAVGKG